MFAGGVTTGAVLAGGSTVTVKLPKVGLPAPSLAVQLTVVVPREKVLPDCGVQVIVGVAVTRSVAVTV
jgi:hypothetical protein